VNSRTQDGTTLYVVFIFAVDKIESKIFFLNAIATKETHKVNTRDNYREIIHNEIHRWHLNNSSYSIIHIAMFITIAIVTRRCIILDNIRVSLRAASFQCATKLDLHIIDDGCACLFGDVRFQRDEFPITKVITIQDAASLSVLPLLLGHIMPARRAHGGVCYTKRKRIAENLL